MLGLIFSYGIDWGSYNISVAKLPPRKLEPSFYEVSFSWRSSVFWPCMEYCCHVWAGVPSCWVELLDKLHKRICRTVGPSFAASLELIVHRRNVASLSLFYNYCCGRCLPELVQLVLLPYFRGSSTYYSDRLHDFFVTIPLCYKDVYDNSFFPRRTWLWNSLPIECFPLICDLNGFKSRINRGFYCRFFLNRFPVSF